MQLWPEEFHFGPEMATKLLVFGALVLALTKSTVLGLNKTLGVTNLGTSLDT
jgi:hypothetical protein